MADEQINRIEAGGFEGELRRVIDQVEAEREGLLRSTRGRKARAGIVGGAKAEILRRFGQKHPDVRVRFLCGPYRDPDVPRGQPGRKR